MVLDNTNSSMDVKEDDRDSWRDLTFKNQVYYQFDHDPKAQNEIIKEDGFSSNIEPGSLIKVFPFGNETLNMETICRGLHDNDFKLDTKYSKSTLGLLLKNLHLLQTHLQKLFHPTPTHLKCQFDLPPIQPLSNLFLNHLGKKQNATVEDSNG